MDKFIVMSACYEVTRYGHDKIKRQTIDAHTGGKLSKFIITPHDLIDRTKPPTIDNYRFEARQADDADIVEFSDTGTKKSIVLKDSRVTIRDLIDNQRVRTLYGGAGLKK
jgi:hypothetical protein